MPKLVMNGAVLEDRWPADQILTLEQWQEKSGAAVQLEADQPPAPLFGQLSSLELVVINFTNFMDGRSFSYARELRDQGYTGELRVTGSFIPDQLHYLQRCGFDSFEVEDELDIDEILARLGGFTEHYQAAVDKPEPLFRHRD